MTGVRPEEMFMGKYLQIQVRAWTYDEEELLKAWPCLTSLAWSEYDARNAPTAKHGVMDLAENLPDILRFGEFPQDVKALMIADAEKAYSLANALSRALADWQPREANRISEDLESVLTGIEEKLAFERRGGANDAFWERISEK